MNTVDFVNSPSSLIHYHLSVNSSCPECGSCRTLEVEGDYGKSYAVLGCLDCLTTFEVGVGGFIPKGYKTKLGKAMSVDGIYDRCNRWFGIVERG